MKALNGLTRSLGGLQSALEKAKEGGHFLHVPCARIKINKQVRRIGLTPEALAEMAASIRKDSVQQPILIRPLAGDKDFDYELVAGERRLRGSMLAEKDTCPAIVKHISDEDAKRIQRIENTQREALCDADLLAAVQEDLAELKTNKAVAERWSKSEAWVSKVLELAELGTAAQQLVSEGLTGDREVLTTVNRLERKDAAAAAEVVQQISKAEPDANVRKIVQAAVAKAKAAGGVAEPAAPAPAAGGSTKPKAAKPASGKPSAPKREATVDEALSTAFRSIADGSTVAEVKAAFSEVEPKIASHLLAWWEEGDAARQEKTVAAKMVTHLANGNFAPNGPACFAMIAFVDGAQGQAFNLASVLVSAAGKK